MEKQYLNYFADRCEYMTYDDYLAAEYPMGSGVVEGEFRHLVKDRMEQTGMRWRIAGAQTVLSLRAIYVNNDWDTFHAARIQTEQRILYPCKRRLRPILLKDLPRRCAENWVIRLPTAKGEAYASQGGCLLEIDGGAATASMRATGL